MHETDAAVTRSEPIPRDLSALLARALRLAGAAGRPVAASRIAAQAWWVLSPIDPQGAQRINGVMHYLATLPEEECVDTQIHQQSESING